MTETFIGVRTCPKCEFSHSNMQLLKEKVGDVEIIMVTEEYCANVVGCGYSSTKPKILKSTNNKQNFSKN